uniref:DUF4371 domain-containing protein n=1 Tax=Trichuris muris TaxID=70415 RepID=A0A5S6QNG2_TRIMR
MLVFTELWFVRLAVFFEFWSFSLCAVLLIPSSVLSDSKRKKRHYSSEYLTFGFICSPTIRSLPMCVLCECVLSNGAMKPSRLKEHLTKVHPERSRENVAYFRKLRDKIMNRRTLRSVISSEARVERDSLVAPYKISLMIARCGKPHTIGEQLLVPVVNEVLRTIFHDSEPDISRKISLSKNTVQRRIDEMASDAEEALCDLLRSTEFSLQLDESTLPGNETLLLAYVRFIKDKQLTQEFLFERELSTDTKGESIFRVVDHFFKRKAIPLKNIIAVATDGAPSMVGCSRGFVSYLKQVVPEVMTVHCVIHRQHLAAKIRSSCLKERLFRQLCDEKDEEYNRLLLNTEVRWLSRDEDVALRDMLELRQADIAYLADLYEKFNAMNLQLQLALYKRNIWRGELCQFPKLAELKRCPDPCDQDIEVYSEHLEMLHEELKRRFHDVLSMVVPYWEELVELQSNDELKPRLRQGYAAFWLQKQIPILYPRLCVVTELLTKKRNRLQVVN